MSSVCICFHESSSQPARMRREYMNALALFECFRMPSLSLFWKIAQWKWPMLRMVGGSRPG